MKKVAALLLVILLPVLAMGCAQSGGNATANGTADGSQTHGVLLKDKTIGICMPNNTDARWQQTVEKLSAEFENRNCQVQIACAGGNAALQASQIKEMATKKSVDCLIVAAVDSLALTEALQQAKNAGIPVIAYDRLLMNTEAVTCYVGFDSEAAGAALASYIVKETQLETAGEEKRSYTIEFFMGSPEDHNAVLVHQGIMKVLQPYLDKGVLVCRTGRTAFEDACTQAWSGTLAKADCQRYLSDFYTDGAPDILCAASDSLAGGCCEALKDAGYLPEQKWPLITGQNGELEGVKRIHLGYQSVTLYKDAALLIQNCLTAVENILTGLPVQTGGTVCHNGVMQIPALLSQSALVDKENYREILVNSGIFTEDQLTEETT